MWAVTSGKHSRRLYKRSTHTLTCAIALVERMAQKYITPTCTSGTVSNDCIAAFLALHLTPSSSAYLKVRSLPVFSCFQLTIIYYPGRLGVTR